ncbi:MULTISPECIES: reverse transcriptase domain-containing protein [Rahnella]|uniref:reverse transcriptase domain-containing protein n=1 Tax=Rahnella TaxID=34037 RepID=UPI0010CEE5DF|nr:MULTISPECIES: reverse transcriptase domain-containing protein [Rahnella]TCQ83173.1 RNA-directed DNA polymerase [Rahnella sp. JUb53]
MADNNLDRKIFFKKNGLSESQSIKLDIYAKNLESKNLPIIYELKHLSKLLGMEYALLSRMSGINRFFYRSFSIKKRNGGRRIINSPYPKISYVQNWIKDKILSQVPISNNAYAYVNGLSHIEHARQHIGSDVFLKIDLLDFFGQISDQRVKKIFSELGYTDKLSLQLARLCTCNSSIAQGAPSSPILSNIVLKELDETLFTIANSNSILYTRYADDIYFSGKHVSKGFFSKIKGVINNFGMVINEEKSKIYKSHHKKIVTGIIVNQKEIRAPKHMRRRFRTESYILLKDKFKVFNGERGLFNPNYIDEILGLGMYILSVEPQNAYVIKIVKSLKALKKEFAQY